MLEIDKRENLLEIMYELIKKDAEVAGLTVDFHSKAWKGYYMLSFYRDGNRIGTANLYSNVSGLTFFRESEGKWGTIKIDLSDPDYFDKVLVTLNSI